MPEGLKDLDKKEILHTEVCEKENMKALVENILL